MDYIAAVPYRSVSDNGDYIQSVREAVASPAAFTRFKQDARYQYVLEHLSLDKGLECLAILEAKYPDLLVRSIVGLNDMVGSPTTYPSLVVHGIPVSPSSLRYLKIVGDLLSIYPGKLPSGLKIAEIGVGYGGQCLLLDAVLPQARFTLFDLPPVLELASKYLECHLMQGSYTTTSLNRCSGQQEYDLVVSNYAFSELPSAVQRVYLEKVLTGAGHGYMIMNSGREGCAFQGDHLSVDQIREYLPQIRVEQEEPSTHPGNYVIRW